MATSAVSFGSTSPNVLPAATELATTLPKDLNTAGLTLPKGLTSDVVEFSTPAPQNPASEVPVTNAQKPLVKPAVSENTKTQ